MPKEYVHEDGGFPSGPRVRVSWSRDSGLVQVASVSDEVPSASGMDDEGWFVSLDRRGINDLIRHLRRARDQALGRDE